MEFVELPQWDTDLAPHDRQSQMLSQLDAWIHTAALYELASCWGSEPPMQASTETLFSWYDDYSAEHWDFRAGLERNQAPKPSLAKRQEAAARKAADAVGLLRARPPRRTQYDFALILGGLVRACITRPRYTAELIDSGLVVGQVLALGGFRPLRGDEVALALELGVAADNEFEAMVAGMSKAFDTVEAPRIESSTQGKAGNADWAVAHYDQDSMQVIAAPSRDPQQRRSNTADTFAWWADRTHHLEGRHVLLITNPIYVPYQGAAAIENLGMPYDVTVETVGISAAAADLGRRTQSFDPTNYLQEIRSAIRGYRSLLKAVDQVSDSS